MKYKVEVSIEGSKKPLTADVDGRDIRAWETKHSGKSFLHEPLTYTMLVELSYTALQRAGKTDLGWDEFDASCTWAKDVSGEGAAADVDPTPKSRGGGSSRK